MTSLKSIGLMKQKKCLSFLGIALECGFEFKSNFNKF